MKQSLLLWLSLLYGIGGYSQSVQSQVIGSAGDHFETNEAQMAFTIGEVVTETFGAGDLILTQGFHQTNLMVTSIEDLAAEFQLRVFPNPTVDLLSIDAQRSPESFSLELMDTAGRPLLLQRSMLNGTTHQINLSNYPPGIYLLRLRTEDRKNIQTFKIVKLN
jgi:hypothetical protein